MECIIIIIIIIIIIFFKIADTTEGPEQPAGHQDPHQPTHTVTWPKQPSTGLSILDNNLNIFDSSFGASIMECSLKILLPYA